MAGTIATSGKGWGLPYAEAAVFIHTSEMFTDRKSRATLLEPVWVVQGLPPRDVAP